MVARDGEERGTIAGDGRPQGTSGGGVVAGRVDEPVGRRSPSEIQTPRTGGDDNVKGDDHDDGENNNHNRDGDKDRDGGEGPDGRNGCSPRKGAAVASRPLKEQKTNDAPDVIAIGGSGAEDETSCRSPTPEEEEEEDEEGAENTLRGVREGPMRDVLTSLLTSTVMIEDGRRVLAPTFPSISALRELKYCGPVKPLQASVLERVLFARYGAFFLC